MNVSEDRKKTLLKLESEDIVVRKEAIEFLIKNNDKELINLLIALLKQNASCQFKESACTILGELKIAEAVDVLIEKLEDPFVGVRFHAIIALGKIGSEKAIDPLLKKLNRKVDPLHRSEAINALGNIKDKRTTKPIINALLHDRDTFVKQSAAVALGKIGGKKALDALRRMSRKEKNSRLHYLVLNAIQEIEKGLN